MIFAGIDCGLSGGVALCATDDTPGSEPYLIKSFPMPVKGHFSGKGKEVDAVELAEAISFFVHDDDIEADYGHNILVTIERVYAMPVAGRKQGASSMFSFGYGAGRVTAAIEMMDWEMLFLLPQKWQKELFPKAKKGDPKAAALEFVNSRFPGVNLLASERCYKPHQGMVDALCIMEAGRRIIERGE